MATKKIQTKQPELVKVSKLAEISKIRSSTIKFYSDLGLLPYEQGGERLAKRYPVKQANNRLKEIMQLKDKGKSVAEITKLLKNKN